MNAAKSPLFLPAICLTVLMAASHPAVAEEQQAPSANLVNNAGFEDTTLAPWEWYVENGADTVGEIDRETRHLGHASFRMSKESPSEPQVYGALRQTIKNVAPGTTYQVRAWVKGEDAEGCVMIVGEKWEAREKVPSGTTGWTEIAKEYTTGPEETELQVVFIADKPTRNLWVDDVSVVPSSAK